MTSVIARTAQALLTLSLIAGAASASAGDEVLVFMRHAEKPAQGLGQLNCQGLNRSLALPHVLLAGYGTPAAIFAPNPSELKDDDGARYSYIRPLATIEPTAIRVGLPINTAYGFEDISSLEKALLAPELHTATVFIAWEHRLAHQAVQELVAQLGGDVSAVPTKWDGKDFDSLYVLTLHWQGGKATVTFKHEREGLDSQAKDCPF